MNDFIVRSCMHVISIFLSLFLFYGVADTMKCNKCHREDKTLDKIFQEKAIYKKEDLFNTLRNGSKAKIHQHLTDEEINEAANKMNLK